MLSNAISVTSLAPWDGCPNSRSTPSRCSADPSWGASPSPRLQDEMLSFVLLRVKSSFMSSSHLSHLAGSNQLNDKRRRSQASTLSPEVSLSKMVSTKKRCLLNFYWMNLKIHFFPSSASCGLLVNRLSMIGLFRSVDTWNQMSN